MSRPIMGIYPLKFFFSESILKVDGDTVSSKGVREIMKKVISNESKSSPYTDEKIASILAKQGYKIARRTITKYREQTQYSCSTLEKGNLIAFINKKNKF